MSRRDQSDRTADLVWTTGEALSGTSGSGAEGPGTGEPGSPARPRWRAGAFGGRLGLGVVGLGLLVIGLGWNGASGAGGEVNHVPAVAAQLPWLLSGGFLGVGIVLLGVALIITHAHREDRARLEAQLVELVETVERLGVARPGGSALTSGSQRAVGAYPSPTAVPGVAPADLAGLVVAGTASFHDPACRLAEGREDLALLTPAEARARGLAPCRICLAGAALSAPAAATPEEPTPARRQPR